MRAELLLTVKAGEGLEALKAQDCFLKAQNACKNLGLSFIKELGANKCHLKVEGPADRVQRIFAGLTAEFNLEQLK